MASENHGLKAGFLAGGSLPRPSLALSLQDSPVCLRVCARARVCARVRVRVCVRARVCVCTRV